MPDYIASDTELTSIANAIRTKGGTSAPLVFPNGFVSAIGDIQTGGGGGGGSSASISDVIFYDPLANDCVGGIAYSYTAAEFASLSSMPANPNHSNFSIHGISIPMTSQGWNWSLADAKAYVAKYGKLNIGQMYAPTDGKSHYLCYIPTDAPTERMNTEINLSVTGGSVNWQVDDGTTSTASGSISATFPSVGWHDVKISAPSGVSYYPYRSSSSPSSSSRGKIERIIHVFIGNDVEEIGTYAFEFANCIQSIILPDSIANIESYAFDCCYNLKNITIPSGVTNLNISVLQSCHSMTFAAIPNGILNANTYSFEGCYSLTSITLPDGVTSIGTYAFQHCYSLTCIIIPDSVTSIGNGAFDGCNTLSSITIPDGVTKISDTMLYTCYGLRSIVIPDSVTIIDNYALQYCNSLTTIIIPDSVTSIGTYAFANCCGLKNIIMESSTPPTLSNVNAFNNLLSDYSIIVPAGSRSAYTSASKWSTLADHIVEAS